MQRKIITTADGSKTIHLPDWDEQYHSKNGAVQEALHVFIKTGLHHLLAECHLEPFDCAQDKLRRKVNQEPQVSILEIGFGTGLNAYLTLLESDKLNVAINFVGVEAYPVISDEIKVLNYPKVILDKEQDELFDVLHSSDWETKHQIIDLFSLVKRKQFFKDIDEVDAYNLIYFDAFGARVQPEHWTEDIFQIMYNSLKSKGVLVTYSAKGSVRRAMQAVGFTVERLPGPLGKREMLRATK